MVAGLDPNFGMVPAFGKAKECQEKEKEDREEEKKDADLEQRLRSMSLGASRYNFSWILWDANSTPIFYSPFLAGK